MKKTLLSLILATAVLFSCAPLSAAQELPADSEPEYLEHHYQVNLDDLDVFVVNGTEVDVAVNNDLQSSRKTKVANDVAALQTALSKYDGMESAFVAQLNSSDQLAAVSFTEVPLLLVDGHFERVLAADASTYESSDTNGKGHFLMFTSVSRKYTQNSNGTYNYVTTTYGFWANNSAGGEDYPDAGGHDYVLQSTPNTWVRKSHEMYANYNSSDYTGDEGDEFWAEDGGTNYLHYAVKDDPYDFLHGRQMTDFGLSCESEAYSSSSARMINSYYIHTWTNITLDVELSVTSSKEVALSISPSKSTGNWQVYNYITFNF